MLKNDSLTVVLPRARVVYTAAGRYQCTLDLDPM